MISVPTQTIRRAQEPAHGAEQPPMQAEDPSAPVDGIAIHHGDAELPPAVSRMRDRIIEASRTGIIERLRPVLESNEVLPTLSFDVIDDPIEHLKSQSGDEAGQEILAILLEVMQAGWVHVDVGTPQEMYLWPYFAGVRLSGLSPAQMVELFTLVTAQDYKDMAAFGAYNFYRVGIGPDGTWHYFVIGD